MAFGRLLEQGSLLTIGSDNIDSGNVAVAGDSGTIRIGTAGAHTSSGQLGTLPSSRRSKEQIEDMDETTDRLLDLRPVGRQ